MCLKPICALSFKHFFSKCILLVFILVPSILVAQNCTSSQFAKEYEVNSMGANTFLEQLPGGTGFLFGGTREYHAAVTSVDNEGTLTWSRLYKYDQATHYDNTTRQSGTIDSSGNCLINLDANCYALLDPAGFPIVTKAMHVEHAQVFGRGMAVLPDNKKILLVFDESSYDRGFMLLCLSPDLSTIIWNKHISGGNMTFGKITIDGNKILIAGSWRSRATILCFDATTGNLTTQKTFTVDNRATSFERIYSYTGGYIVDARYYGALDNHHLLFRLDKNLNVLNVYRFLNVPSSRNVQLAVEPDGSYYGASGSTKFYVDPHDSIRWVRSTYLHPLLGPQKLINTKEGLVALSTGFWHPVYTVETYSAAGLSRSDANGRFLNCSPFSAVFEKTSMVYSIGVSSIDARDTSKISMIDGTITVSDNDPAVSERCRATSICNSLQVDGRKTFCADETAEFLVKRNSGCVTPVKWTIEGEPAFSYQLNDSTISIRFRDAGTYKVIATLKSCETISDTITIDVSSAGPQLDLGPDTVICKNNTIQLNAKKGFVSYLWQDGSTDSLFNVVGAGLYYVTATDGCGAIQRDSILVNEFPPIPFDIGPDRTKCNDDTIHLSAPAGFLHYEWSPADNIDDASQLTVAVNPKADRYYYLKAETVPGCFVYDSVYITVFSSPLLELGADTSICAGNSVQFTAASSFSEYSWNTGSNNSSIIVNHAGIYRLEARDHNGCIVKDSVVLTSLHDLPVFSLGNDFDLCANDRLILDPGSFSAYSWQDGSRSRNYSVSTSGLYWVAVTDYNGCTFTDSVLVNKILPAPADFLKATDSICRYDHLLLTPLQPFHSYQWSTGSSLPSLMIDKEGIYSLIVKDSNGCTGTDSIFITSKTDCYNDVNIPTAFSPNGDQLNDQFRASVPRSISSFRLEIFNRNGEKVFMTTDPNKGWDGKIKGVLQSSSVFTWQCIYQLPGGKPTHIRGTVTLLR